MLTAREFHQLAVAPPEVEWLANITNERTRRAYKKHVGEFAAFLQLEKPESFRLVTRAHLIRWPPFRVGEDLRPRGDSLYVVFSSVQ